MDHARVTAFRLTHVSLQFFHLQFRCVSFFVRWTKSIQKAWVSSDNVNDRHCIRFRSIDRHASEQELNGLEIFMFLSHHWRACEVRAAYVSDVIFNENYVHAVLFDCVSLLSANNWLISLTPAQSAFFAIVIFFSFHFVWIPVVSGFSLAWDASRAPSAPTSLPHFT